LGYRIHIFEPGIPRVFYLGPEAGKSDLVLGFRTWSWVLRPESGIWDLKLGFGI